MLHVGCRLVNLSIIQHKRKHQPQMSCLWRKVNVALACVSTFLLSIDLLYLIRVHVKKHVNTNSHHACYRKKTLQIRSVQLVAKFTYEKTTWLVVGCLISVFRKFHLCILSSLSYERFLEKFPLYHLSSNYHLLEQLTQ